MSPWATVPGREVPREALICTFEEVALFCDMLLEVRVLIALFQFLIGFFAKTGELRQEPL